MRAIYVTKFGKESELKIDINVPKPKINDDQVLVKVHAAGVNPVDTYIRQGLFGHLPGLPYVPGSDGAGVVEEVGASIRNIKVSQRVHFCAFSSGSHSGSYGEYIAVDEDKVFPLPPDMTYEEGAAIGIPYYTAYRALVLKCQVQAGQTVLVHGASGAVGLAAVQIARQLGATVLGTAGSKSGLDLVLAQGAARVYDHRNDPSYPDTIKEAGGVDAIIEMLASTNLQKDLTMLKPRGKVAVVGCRGKVTIDPRDTMLPETCVVGVALAASTKEEWHQTTAAVQQGLDQGIYKPVVDRTYPLEEAPKAHHDIMHSTGAKGKLVLTLVTPTS